MSNIVLCVTGGIAAYKAVDLVSKLKKAAHNVDVLMTKSACEFVTPLTFESISQNRVVSNMFDRDFSFDVEHISLAKKADLFVIVPATANVIGKICYGIADDMVTTTVMATKAPVLIAPAMNTNMYENSVVQENIKTLKNRGFHFVEPESGRLACGDVGRGKLADTQVIFEEIQEILTEKDLNGVNILITAGATREALDPVRFLSNNSTGKMGYELARAATMRGAKVTLVTGKTAISKPNVYKTIEILSANDMYDVVLEEFSQNDIIIKAAAVADYRPKTIANNKIKKKDGEMSIELEKTNDILKKLGEIKNSNQFLCGFSMETRDLIENSTKKLENKNADMIIANDLTNSGAGFGTDTNIVSIITKNDVKKLEIMSKFEVSNKILDEIIKLR